MRLLLTIALFLAVTGSASSADWEFSKHSIPLDEIRAGGPPKDGIPALTIPDYVSAANADYMRSDEQVLGVVRNGIARAYPTRILSWHELVNDTFRGDPLLVSW